ncbi:unnamed protein product [Owenia fusiformis]|uniref:JmjC domain-containing protein n=1 Tax=Owenia fusiformis TaxID=6347 RepID=A0A8S4NNG1_OWEFU|nr:unnamed protein product [Owenia fusiformis]
MKSDGLHHDRKPSKATYMVGSFRRRQSAVDVLHSMSTPPKTPTRRSLSLCGEDNVKLKAQTTNAKNDSEFIQTKKHIGPLFPKERTIGGISLTNIKFICIVLSVLLACLLVQKMPVSKDHTTESNNATGANMKHIPGDWRPADTATLKKYGSNKCNIDRVNADDLTEEKFELIYRLKKPVIVYFDNGAAAWTDPSLWTLSSLRASYGDLVVGSGRADDIVKNGGNGDIKTTLNKFIELFMDDKSNNVAEPFYLFDRNFYKSTELQHSIKPPPYFKSQTTSKEDAIVFLGSSLSGVTFHQHADTWNGVIFGHKRWFLYPPDQTPPGGVLAGFVPTDWYTMVYPSLHPEDKPMECMQNPGEILYLPEYTYHSTINLGDTVAVGIQKLLPVTQYGRTHHSMMRPGVFKILKDEYGTTTSDPPTSIALITFLKLVAEKPDNTELKYKLAGAYAKVGRMEEARETYNKVLEMDPYFIHAYLDFATMLYKMKEFKEAEKNLLAALKFNPKSMEALHNYGLLLTNLGRFKEATGTFKKMVALRPWKKGPRELLAYAQGRAGDVKGQQATKNTIEQLERSGKIYTQ